LYKMEERVKWARKQVGERMGEKEGGEEGEA
jgi:hypothetical protein